MQPPIYLPCRTSVLSLAEYQADFAEGLRSDSSKRQQAYNGRLGLYKKLIFANLCSFIDSCFPVCRSLLSPAVWRQLCRAFLREHACQSPLFHQIPLEFISWLQMPHRFRHNLEPAYLTHLAHYEYCELQIQTAPDINHYAKPNNCALFITPIQLVCYPYPVHTIGPKNPAPALATTRLLLWRKADDSAGFAEITANIYCLLELLQHKQDLAEIFTHWAPLCTPAASLDEFVASMQNLATLGVIEIHP
ncbi:MAG TPA: putative DNA-binding domain-containing protein [Cellvibrionaceae bacterium]|nr:putative DNA-binding domain-containing protein [Cellvibrionaceae bacterium]HMW72823.1 putative DNA-binding domain-containing protein [Cellvibrionaceae bacterium]HMY39099.1 putative DNA-binding domain-containing protein [Marinagarivorans sp.]HNG58518.1 putative DNA-binding domain-containing protein [Cellvibrionaceae bacterium]